MQTYFSLQQLADPETAQSEAILRACVHCGFCTATCPTFLLTGDELDSPRGRISLIKDMLENDRAADARTARHIDRCLSCLSCMTTCPSSVHYMHLVDHARAHIEKTFARPLGDRLLRALLAFLLPRPKLFRAALRFVPLLQPLAGFAPERLRAMAAMAPAHLPPPSPVDQPQTFPAQGERKLRVALLNGCAQTVLDPAINEATIRLLTRHGCEVVVASGAGCCGALAHHLGKSDASHASARANIEAWTRAAEQGGIDRIVINTSGCGTTVKDYGHMFRNDPALAQQAAHVSSIARDVSEIVSEIGLSATRAATPLRVAYHSACSLQHGQKITSLPVDLLRQAGFDVALAPEAHLCCGSAGVYNLLQPAMANALRERKVDQLTSVAPDVIAAGNLGCMMQIAGGTAIPVVHTVELLDWASGGLPPARLQASGIDSNGARGA